MQFDVKDNHERSRFEADVDGVLAVAEYQRAGGTIRFTHTKVPAQLEGHGVGTALARAALDVARAEKLKVIPQCPFIAAFIKDNPEYQDLVSPE